jgi:hypothetical protein
MVPLRKLLFKAKYLHRCAQQSPPTNRSRHHFGVHTGYVTRNVPRTRQCHSTADNHTLTQTREPFSHHRTKPAQCRWNTPRQEVGAQRQHPAQHTETQRATQRRTTFSCVFGRYACGDDSRVVKVATDHTTSCTYSSADRESRPDGIPPVSWLTCSPMYLKDSTIHRITPRHTKRPQHLRA